MTSLLELSITHIIMVITTSTSDLILFPILSLVIGLCLDRATQFLNKLYFCVTVLITSWTDKKQRRGSTVALIGVSVFLFPLVLLMVSLATVLSAPLLPLFTLPLFVMGFPRPNKFWPENVGASANVNPDTMFYKQLAPVLSGTLGSAFADGRLGRDTLHALLMPFLGSEFSVFFHYCNTFDLCFLETVFVYDITALFIQCFVIVDKKWYKQNKFHFFE